MYTIFKSIFNAFCFKLLFNFQASQHDSYILISTFRLQDIDSPESLQFQGSCDSIVQMGGANLHLE